MRHIKATQRTALRSAFGILLLVALGLVGSSTLTSCHKRLALTIVEVEDSVRHYPSVVLGDELTMVFVLRNTGDEMLVITGLPHYRVGCGERNNDTARRGGADEIRLPR